MSKKLPRPASDYRATRRNIVRENYGLSRKPKPGTIKYLGYEARSAKDVWNSFRVPRVDRPVA